MRKRKRDAVSEEPGIKRPLVPGVAHPVRAAAGRFTPPSSSSFFLLLSPPPPQTLPAGTSRHRRLLSPTPAARSRSRVQGETRGQINQPLDGD